MKKNERLLHALGTIDERFIEEAIPERKEGIRNAKMKKSKWLKYSAIAAMLILVVAANLWLFIPFNTTPPSVAAYSGSEYYPLIEKLNALGFKPPKYKNNFESIVASLNDTANGDIGVDGNAGSAPGNSEESLYEEVTDNQVSGVIEGDVIKRSTNHIYRLYLGELSIYSIAGEGSSKIASYDITANRDLKYESLSDWEMYLSSDCKTVTVIAACDGRIAIISYNVENPIAITERHRVYIDGVYSTSRLVNGELLIISDFSIIGRYYYAEPETYVPEIEIESEKFCIGMDSIFTPEKLTNYKYTVVTKLRENDLSLCDSAAFLSYTGEVFVSNTSVYISRPYVAKTKSNGVTTEAASTEITRLDYSGDSFVNKGSVSFSGTVLDQYSIDEYEGKLRVAASVSEAKYKEIVSGNSVSMQHQGFERNASLYIFDIETMQLLSSVERFAPAGETVRSARFNGSSAYVCTAIELVDPVFFFDLSDINNITYTNTGTISGFSTSLISYGDILLGIGVGEFGGVKLEIYREEQGEVKSLSKYEKDTATYSSEYKSYFIDRENMLIGLPLDSYSELAHKYFVFAIRNDELVLLIFEGIVGELDLVRATYIDGYMYIFGEDITVRRLKIPAMQ